MITLKEVYPVAHATPFTAFILTPDTGRKLRIAKPEGIDLPLRDQSRLIVVEKMYTIGTTQAN